MILYKRNSYIYYEDIDGSGEIRGVPNANVEFDDVSAYGQITVSIFRNQLREHKNFFSGTFLYDEIYDSKGNAYGDSFKDVTYGFDKGLDVSIQDQHTQAVIVKFNRVHASTTLSVLAVVNAYTITVTSPTGIAQGNYIILYNPSAERFTTFTALSIAGSVVTLDCPVDFAYPIGTFVDIATTNLNVNGSVTPVTFGIRGTTIPQEAVPIELDVTRILFNCEAASAVDLSKFADLTALTRGLCIRKRDGENFNILNIKSNGDLAAICYDWTAYASSNPVAGQDGFTARLTFAGQEKIGVVQRLAAGQDLECIIQDNLTGITKLEIVAEGHIVEP